MTVASAAIACTMLFGVNVGPPHYHVLAKTDGTVTGTQIVKDIDGRDERGFPIHYLTAIGEELIFVAGRFNYGWELHRTDGTAEGTRLVRDYTRGSIGTFEGDLRTEKISVVGRKAYFGSLEKPGMLVYDTDTKGLTWLSRKVFGVKAEDHNVTAGPHVFGVEETKLLVEVGLGHAGWPSIQMWDTETQQSEALAEPSGGVGLGGMASIGNGKFLMPFEHYYAPYETGFVVASDGTSSGTEVLLESIIFLDDFERAFGKSFFTGWTSKIGDELWYSDGTKEGTGSININFGSASSNPEHLTAFEDWLYFSATTASKGRELWRSDGTKKNTKIVADHRKGTLNLNPTNLTALGKHLLFTSGDGYLHLLRDAASGGNAIEQLQSGGHSIFATKIVRFGQKALIVGRVGERSGLFLLKNLTGKTVHLMDVEQYADQGNFNSFETLGSCG